MLSAFNWRAGLTFVVQDPGITPGFHQEDGSLEEAAILGHLPATDVVDAGELVQRVVALFVDCAGVQPQLDELQQAALSDACFGRESWQTSHGYCP